MPDIDLTAIAPVTDTKAARLASPAAFADLADQITAYSLLTAQPTELPPLTGPAGTPRPGFGLRPGRRSAAARGGARGGWSRRRALRAGLPLVALGAAAAVLVALFVPGNNSDNGANSQDAIQALSFTRANGYITVIIRNPYADTTWFNADFARHHLDIKLALVAASPSVVDSVDYVSADPGVKILSAGGHCYSASSDTTGPCLDEIKVPADYHGQAIITLGRPARPGEQYETVGSIFGPGEALAGLLKQVAGQPLSKVRPILARHHLSVAFDRDASNQNVNPSSVPGDYYVTDIMPWAPGQVMISTSQKQFYDGSERVPSMSTGPTAPPGMVRVTPAPSTSSAPH
jgi:hypothetical protein